MDSRSAECREHRAPACPSSPIPHHPSGRGRGCFYPLPTGMLRPRFRWKWPWGEPALLSLVEEGWGRPVGEEGIEWQAAGFKVGKVREGCSKWREHLRRPRGLSGETELVSLAGVSPTQDRGQMDLALTANGLWMARAGSPSQPPFSSPKGLPRPCLA